MMGNIVIIIGQSVKNRENCWLGLNKKGWKEFWVSQIDHSCRKECTASRARGPGRRWDYCWNFEEQVLLSLEGEWHCGFENPDLWGGALADCWCLWREVMRLVLQALGKLHIGFICCQKDCCCWSGETLGWCKLGDKKKPVPCSSSCLVSLWHPIGGAY